MMTRQSDRRRHPRSDVSWLVVVEAGKRRFLLQTMDISARGTKVRPRERLDIGTPAQLRFRPPDGTPFNVPALVWRLVDEERVLGRDLPGYAAYCARVHYRLVPGIW